MAASQHYVIIGNGVAGNEAASCLRARDSDSRITLITAGRLLFQSARIARRAASLEA